MSTLKCRSMAIAVILVSSALAHAQTPNVPDDLRTWTTVGSAGTVDEASTAKVVLDHSTAQLGQTLGSTTTAAAAPAIAQTESAVIRYNVVPVDGLFAGRVPAPSARGHQLRLRYLAAGPGARVVARLIEVDLRTGVEAPPLLTFDSSAPNVPHTAGYRVDQTSDCGPPRAFDFVNKAYYVEVTLTHSAIVAGSAAGVQIIKVATDVCRG